MQGLGAGVVAGAVAFGTLLLGGCAQGTDRDSVAEPMAVWGWAPGSGGDDALLEGTLALQAGCLYVVAADGTRTLPVFPESLVSWDDEARTLRFNHETYALGDDIWAAGGWFEPSGSAVIPSACELDAYGQAMHVQTDTLSRPSA